MQKKKRLIDFHFEWLKNGKIPWNGLCSCFEIELNKKHSKLLYLFQPDEEQKMHELNSGRSYMFWGSGEQTRNAEQRRTNYSERRQNIVLLICAMLNEL